MKWICNYCQKVVEKDNFIEVLEKKVWKTRNIMPGAELWSS
jgi:hypothetical protein